jgi:hypothetical protein
MPVQVLAPEILSKVAQFHVGLGYYMARKIQSVYEAHRLLVELGLNPHRFVKRPGFSDTDYWGRQVRLDYPSYDFILEGTQDDPMPCNIASYNGYTGTLQFFVNKEAGTFGRPHGSKEYYWQYVA